MIRLGVLGTIRVWTDDGAELNHVMAGDHRTALLVHLVLGWPGLRRRESIIALLWPDQRIEHARHSLRQLLHVLREELGPAVIVTTGGEYVGVDASRLWCDALAFRQAASGGSYERALELYVGPFCEGLSLRGAPEYDRWLERTRREFHELAAESARLLAYRCEASGNAADAVRWGKRALRLNPGDERMLRWLVQVTAREEGAAAAVGVYDEFARTMRVEYELETSDESAALIRALRTQYR